MLPMVTMRPDTLTGVRRSWKTTPAALIVTTSLKIPQMLSVTTEDRWSSANSEEIMQKAIVPGKIRKNMALKMPCSVMRSATPLAISSGRSTESEITPKETNMMGVRKKRVENGFE